MSEELRIFLATIWGEAAQSSADAWKAIASVIMNRVGVREWHKWKTPVEIIQRTGFDAYSHRNAPYRNAEKYFRDWHPGGDLPRSERLESLYQAAYLIYYGREPRTTDAVLYYSPKAQAKLHGLSSKPGYNGPRWPAKPRWNFDLLEQVQIPGTEKDDFHWFRYRTPGAPRPARNEPDPTPTTKEK